MERVESILGRGSEVQLKKKDRKALLLNEDEVLLKLLRLLFQQTASMSQQHLMGAGGLNKWQLMNPL